MDPNPLTADLDGLRRLARSLVLDPSEADDVVQETVAIALERSIPAGASASRWLRGVCRNVARRLARGESRRRRRETLVALEEATPTTDEIVIRAAEQRRILDALVSLREPYRSTLFRRYFDDRPPRRIASDEGIPVETVRTRLTRGLSLLRRELDRQHGGNRSAWVALLLPNLPPPSPTGSTLTGVSLLMTVKAKSTVALLLLAAIAVLVWFSTRPPHPVDEPSLPGAMVADARRAPEFRDSAVEASRERPAPDSAPVPVASAHSESSTPGQRLEGVVLTTEGDPLPGARVYVGPPDTTLHAFGTPSVTTDAGGSFTFDPPDRWLTVDYAKSG